MSRHIERAENTARLLDVTYRMSLLPYDVVEPGLAWAEPWAVPLITNGLATAYYERYPRCRRRTCCASYPRRGEPVVDLLLPAGGAGIGALGSRRDHVRDVRGPELAVARGSRLRLRAIESGACRNSWNG
jgi:hypothetical protein